MLDSYIDQAQDAQTDSWSAIAYYRDPLIARRRVAELIERALRDVAQLRHGQRHTVIVAAMVAMYLTSDSATAGPLAQDNDRLRRAGGALTRILIPPLRCWRVGYRQRR
jgi:hypothetical protein